MTYELRHGNRVIATLRADNKRQIMTMFRLAGYDRYEYNGERVKTTLICVPDEDSTSQD